MNPYFAGSFILAVFGFLGGLIWYSNRAGQNSARVISEKQTAENSAAEVAASQHALNARTNGIRSDNQLISTLEKGQF